MGTIAAPLLASVSVALVAVVLSSASSFRWANATLLLLVVAAAAFIASVECSYMARQYTVSPTDLEAWWPDADAPIRREMLRREQRYYFDRFEAWSARARLGYNVAILAFSLGVSALLVPRSWDHASDARLAVLAVAILGFVAELLWILTTQLKRPTIQLPPVGPEKLLDS
jgi:hypothetical protein